MVETSLSLLEQIQRDGAAEQWTRLIDLYTPLLRAWLSRYDDVAAADRDDLVQEALLAVSQELPRFEHRRPGSFRSWLRQILANRLRNFWRARQHQPMAVGGSDFLRHIEELSDDRSALSQAWDRDHDRAVMRHLFGLVRLRFAERTWQAFWLQVIDGQSAEEAAGRLGISLSSAYVAKFRVLQALRTAAAKLVE